MIETKELKTIDDFEALNAGDCIACEFRANVHTKNKLKPWDTFGVYHVVLVRKDTKEIILDKNKNLYFSYEMFCAHESNCKQVILIFRK